MKDELLQLYGRQVLQKELQDFQISLVFNLASVAVQGVLEFLVDEAF